MTAVYANEEILSQPACWAEAAQLASSTGELLPAPGESVAVVGCGTSWFMAMAYASLRERAGHGLTDAFAASEFPAARPYDRILAISRSGTTTEVLDLLASAKERSQRTSAITAVDGVPIHDVVDGAVTLGFADERSVVQTRFATSALALLRAGLGEDLAPVIADARTALAEADPLGDVEQITFLGRGWTIGLAHEAALKTREAAQFWAESYPAMDYRHGPIAIAQPGRAVWAFGAVPAGLDADVRRTGARFITSDLDPMAHLIIAQRAAVGLASRRGLDVDQPRNLTRAVELPPQR